MTKRKQTWQEKLQQSKPHSVKTLDKDFAGMQAGQQMLISSAKLLDAFIKKYPLAKALVLLICAEHWQKNIKRM